MSKLYELAETTADDGSRFNLLDQASVMWDRFEDTKQPQCREAAVNCLSALAEKASKANLRWIHAVRNTLNPAAAERLIADDPTATDDAGHEAIEAEIVRLTREDLETNLAQR